MSAATPAPTVSRRVAWTLLALAPAVAVSLVLFPQRALGGGAALAAAVAIELAVLGWRGLPLTRLRADPGVVLWAVLAWLWLGPVAADPSRGLMAGLVAGAVGAAFGGTGQSPFHPAAVAIAAIAVIAPLTPAPEPEAWIGIALGSGAALMFARRLLRLPTLAGWAAGLALAWALTGSALPSSAWTAAVLVGGYVLADGGSAGLRAGPRFAAAFMTGVLAATLPGPAALACAVLLANAIVPTLEGAWPRPRPA